MIVFLLLIAAAFSCQAAPVSRWEVTTVAGRGTPGYADGIASESMFRDPCGIAVDEAGTLFVADTGNNCIRKISSGGKVVTVAGNPAGGYADGVGSEARFQRPEGIAVDGAGMVVVADTLNNRIRKISQDGKVTTVAGDGPVQSPPADEGESEALSGTVDIGEALQAPVCPDGKGTEARFSSPRGIAVDETGTLFVADTGNGLVRRITSAGAVSTIALPRRKNDRRGGGMEPPVGIAVIQAGELLVACANDGPGCSLYRVSLPSEVEEIENGFLPSGNLSGIAFHRPGQFFATDAERHLIRDVSSDAGNRNGGKILAGCGVAAFRDGKGRSAGFNGPRGIAVDRFGNIFIADRHNHCIRKLSLTWTDASAPDDRECIGEVLNKPVFRDEIDLQGERRVGDEMRRLFLIPLRENYFQNHRAEFEPTPQELQAALRSAEDRKAARLLEETILSELGEKIEANAPLDDVLGKGALAGVQSGKFARMMFGGSISAWKMQRQIYAAFGEGRVIERESGIEPFDATKRWLESQECAGLFRISAPELRVAFYENWNDADRLTWFTEKLRKSFLEPDWLQPVPIVRSPVEAANEIRALRAKAESGVATAQLILGTWYASGSRNLEAAKTWFRRAAEQGNAEGQFQLGCLVLNQPNVTLRDLNESTAWFRKAAEKGLAAAQYELGRCYSEGRVFSGQSQAAGDAPPFPALASQSLRNDEEAFLWYRKAANQGFALAQWRLGRCYRKGEGVAADDVAAVKWYRQAAEQGLAEAQFALGECHAAGRGVPKDDQEAAHWYRQAAEQEGEPLREVIGLAQFRLAECHAAGRGVPKDDVEAVKWYRRAETMNCVEAKTRLGNCYAEGRGVTQDLREAVKWYRQAATRFCSAEGAYRLGNCFAQGLGIERDEVQAARWFLAAARNGYPLTPAQIRAARQLLRSKR